MSRIRIKNFGPIKDGIPENNGWIDIRKVTVFIGNQGSGKSTIAKLISTFSWIEKALVRGDYSAEWFGRKNRLQNQFLNYHRIEHYFETNGIDNTLIEYQGEAYFIKYENGSLLIDKNPLNGGPYALPQIVYVPAERNFIAYVKKPNELKLSSESLKEFLTEFERAKNEIKEPIRLPVDNTNLEYDKLNDTLNLKGTNYKVKLTDASSGFQSLVPLFLVSSYLAHSVKDQDTHKEPMSSEEIQRFQKGIEDIWKNNTLTDEQRRAAISVLSSKFNKTAFINIVEEPEQNVYPRSQWHLLQSLLEFNNMNEKNKIIITTHSPYIINFLSIVIQGEYVEAKINNSGKSGELLSRLYKIIPKESLTASKDVVVYQLDGNDGSIKILPTDEGIPSDKNFLNEILREGNDLFDMLLDIEEELPS